MEFNAVIFCGDGHDLVPLTSPGESRISKALLPVANKPLIEYVLNWCDQAPFQSVTIVTSMKDEKSLSEVVNKFDKERDTELRNSSPIKLVTSELTSTGAILNDIFPLNEDNINDSANKKNFVILPCDFITDVPPQVFIEVYRGNSDENIGLSLFYNNTFENVDKKALKSNYTVYSNQENGNMVLLDMYSKDFVTIDKFLKIRTQLLWRYPQTLVSTKLLDSFIFFMNWKCRVSTIAKGENNTAISNNNDVQLKRPINKIKRDLSRNSWKHHDCKSTIGLFALPEDSLFVRCNNLPVYMEMNRYYLKDNAKFNPNKHNNNSKENKNAATIGSDCIIGTNSELGERTNVKRSVIGNNASIGKKCRISGCILLDGVSIEDDVQLENCIIGRNVKMESKSRLVNCNVEGSYTVGKNVNLKGETLKNISLDELSDGVLYSSEESEEVSESESDDADSSGYDDEGFEEEEYEDDIFNRG